MKILLVVLAVLAVDGVVFLGYLYWRDRRRLAATDDPAVARAARAERHRQAAEREHAQSDAWNRGGHGFTG